MITIVARFKVLPDKTDEFIKLATDVTRETRKEKGNLSYKILRSQEDKTRFTFIEEWLNEPAIEFHNNCAHFKHFIAAIEPITSGGVEIEKLDKVPSVFF